MLSLYLLRCDWFGMHWPLGILLMMLTVDLALWTILLISESSLFFSVLVY